MNLKKAPVLADNPPLRFIQQTNGIPRLLGVWTLKVQEGFPLDMSCHIASQKGYDIDWVEVVADACNRKEFNSLEKEVNLLLESREEYLTKEDWHHTLLLWSGGMQAHKTEKALYDHIWRERPRFHLNSSQPILNP